MPQVVLLAAIGAGVYAGYRALLRAGERFAAELKRTEDEARQRATAGPEKNLGTLQFDPQSGVYKPVTKA
jgi:hypothetical protein